MGFIVTRYRLLIFLCFILYTVNSHLIDSSHRFPDLFKTDRDEEAKTLVSEGTQTSRLSIKTGHDWRSSDAIMAGQNGDASSKTHREILAWKDSVDRRPRDLEMGSRSFPEEQAEPEVKREIDTSGGEIKRLTDEVIQVRRELEAAKTGLNDVQNALATINSDIEAKIAKQMTAHRTQESITNLIGHETDDDLKAFKDAHGELKTKLDHQKETLLNLSKTKGSGVVELIQELHNQVSSKQEASTKLHVSMDHLIHDTIVDNLKVAIASQYIESTASPAKRRQRREGIGALTTVITSFLSELQQYNKTIQDEKTELMRMSHDSVTGNDLFKLEKCQTDVRTLAQNLENTETVLDLIQVGLREEKRFVRSHFDELKDSLYSFINQRDLLETNLNETTDRLTSVSDELSNVIMEVDSVSTIQDNYNSSTNAQIDEIKDDVDKLKMLCKSSLSAGQSASQPASQSATQPASQPTSQPDTQTDTHTDPCDNGYIHKAPFCLRFVLKPRKSFNGAMRACQEENAHLITEVATRMIHSKAIKVERKIHYFWVGAKKNAASVFVWLSSDDHLLQRDPIWGTGEPNNYNGNEDCVEWADSHNGLNDMRCDVKYPFICEKSEYEYN